MRVITLNLNGIRAAERKGMFNWLIDQDADFVCLQETKAQKHQLQKDPFWPIGYHCFYRDATKKGYSGVALYSRIKPKTVIQELGWPTIDNEGRYIEARLGNLCIVSIYIPSGTSGDLRQEIKYDFLARYRTYLLQCIESGLDYIICGDWNIAHTKIDIKNWRSNQKNSGFLPEERAWLDQIIDDGWIDAFRCLNQEPDQYTWWSNRGQAWANNVGWRIDYQFISPSLADKVQSTTIYKEQRFSDHAPLIIDYDYSLNDQ